MIVNEKDAKGMWCPWARDRGGNLESSCIASECMMWRWTKAGSKEKYERIKTPLIGEEADRAKRSGFKIVNEDDNFLYWERKLSNNIQGEGYCGVAGNPVAAAGSGFVPAGNVRESAPQQTGQVIVGGSGEEIDLDIVKALAGKK